MHLIDNGTQYTPTVPAPQPASGTPGYADNRAPGIGTPTVFDPDLANTLLAELVNIVLASGQTLDRTVNTQLLQALTRIHGAQYFTASGTFTTPAGVYRVWVETWGGGGGASGGSGSSGAGGEYRAGYVDVTPAVGVTITVGAGGSAGTSGSGAGDGGTSSFGSSIVANGGDAGNAGPGGGGTGGTGGSFHINGQGGEDLDATMAVGGSAPRGGMGGTMNNAGASVPPTAPGGGGGSSTGQVTGQAGAVGGVLVRW